MGKNNRETVIMGLPPGATALSMALARATSRPVPEFSATELPSFPVTKLGELIEREVAAIEAKADEENRKLVAAAQGEAFYTGSGADPGAIVGLDAFIPSGDTAENGDPDRTDSDAS